VKPEIISFKQFADDRGIVYGAVTDLDQKGIKRTYVVKNWAKGMVRAWHGHRKADTYMCVIKGSAKLVASNMDDPKDRLVVVLNEYTPGALFIPAGYYNGSVTLEDDTRILVYSTLTLEEVKNDDHRLPHDFYEEDKNSDFWKVKPR
jgi:dTDP-4-dehydrorhamnose 3,5-epimerase